MRKFTQLMLLYHQGVHIMKNMKRWVAFIVAVCAVIGMCVPLSGNVKAASYQFQDYYTEDLGIAAQGSMNMNNFFEVVTYNNNDYLVVPAQGGMMFIYDLTAYINQTPNSKGNYIYAEIETNIGSPRGLIQVGSKVYSVGDANSITVYDFATKKASKISIGEGTYGIVADPDGNVYVTGSTTVYRINAGKTSASTIYETSRLTQIQSIAYYNSKLYLQGTLNSDYGSGSEVHEIGLTQSDNGTKSGWIITKWTYTPKRTLILSGIKATFYMSCVNGMLFFGNVDHLVTVDVTSTNMTRYDGKLNADKSVSLVTSLEDSDTVAPSTLGIIPIDSTGTPYGVISGKGLYSYNAANKTFVLKNSVGAVSRDLRCRDTYMIGDAELILTAGPNSFSAWRLSGTSNFPVALGGAEGILKDGYSIASMRTMAAGVAGNDTVMYVGAYLSSMVTGYNANTGDVEKAFGNGHAQTDALLAYNGKMYAGCYSGAFLVEYDPATGKSRDLISGGLLGDPNVTIQQLRIHALAAGDGKIFFSSLPGDQLLGGYIGVYDIATETYTLIDHVEGNFKNHVVITLAYDEENNILYGGSSVRGGTGTSDSETGQAELLAYSFDPATNKLTNKANITVGSITKGNDTPRYISGIAKDPYSNTFWGLVSQTLFTFKYENGTLTATKAWEASSYSYTDRYPDSSSRSWFPRPILFDDGHLYVTLDQDDYGLSRFDLNAARTAVSNQTKLDSDTGRIYTMGTDLNIYKADGEHIKRIVLSRATMVEQLIDSYSEGATSIDTVLSAYEALTDAEKDRISTKHYRVIQSYLEAECFYYDTNSGDQVITTVEKALNNAGDGNVIYLLENYEGNITLKNGMTLDLNGKTVTGAVNAVNGEVSDTAGGGSVSGQLSVPSANTQMPLLVPGTENTYKFFDYQIVQATVAQADPEKQGAKNFWFDIDFTNAAAYTLLQGDSNLKIGATLSWTESNGNTGSIEIAFDEAVKRWAAADHSQNQGLYVQVTGIPYFGVTDISVTPHITVEGTDLAINMNATDHEVVQFQAGAIFGEYPTDLIAD